MSKQTGFAKKSFGILWDTDLTTVPKWKAMGIRLARFLFVVGRDLFVGRITLHAMSLVYTTLLSIVPLLAIGFSVLKGLGAHNEIEPMLAQFLSPLGQQGAEITKQVIGFVDNMQVGVLGFLGVGLLIYTVVSLIQKIENAFNDTWHVTEPRTLARQFSDYLSVILVGPVLVFTAVGIKASLMSHSIVTELTAVEPLGQIVELAGRVMPVLLVVIAFTFILIFVPNTKVRFKPAFVGGLVSGVIWVAAGWLFASFVVSSVRYTAIYSAFATVIFAMIWLYVSWLILLVGGCIAFYMQHPEYILPKTGQINLSNRVMERLALQITTQIAKTFYDGRTPWQLESLVRRLRVPREAVERVLLCLEEKGLLTRTADDPPSYVPGYPPDETEVKSILDAVRSTGELGQFALEKVPTAPAVKRLMADADNALEVALRGRTLKDLALGENDASSSPPTQLTATPVARRAAGGDG